jgi:hypothetical protein
MDSISGNLLMLPSKGSGADHLPIVRSRAVAIARLPAISADPAASIVQANLIPTAPLPAVVASVIIGSAFCGVRRKVTMYSSLNFLPARECLS